MYVYPLRYYKVDFEEQRIVVKHKDHYADDHEFYSKIIYFRELLDCYKFSEEDEEKEKESRHYPKDLTFPFVLQTTERKFELFTSTDDERKLWVTCFNYIIKCTKESESIDFEAFKKARRE